MQVVYTEQKWIICQITLCSFMQAGEMYGSSCSGARCYHSMYSMLSTTVYISTKQRETEQKIHFDNYVILLFDKKLFNYKKIIV